jgi:hypothetical protein
LVSNSGLFSSTALYALALQAQKAVEENKPLLETNSFNF